MWVRAPSVLFPVKLALVAPPFPVPEHVCGALRAHPFPFPGHVGGRLGRSHFRFRNTWVGRLGRIHFRFRSVLAAKVEASGCACVQGSRAGPLSWIGILSRPRSKTGTGVLIRSQPATAPKLSTHPEWWIIEFSDGLEAT